MLDIGIISTSRGDRGLLEKLEDALIDGFDVDVKFLDFSGCRAEGDSAAAIARTMGLQFIQHAEFYPRPELVVCLGDRHDLFPVVVCAFLNKIPIAHLHGGEKTAGSYDDIWRTGISMMASLHFPATSRADANLAHMGITKNVYMVGALGVDGLKKRKIQPRNNKVILMLYPETGPEAKLDPRLANDILDLLVRRKKSVMSIGSSPDVGYRGFGVGKAMSRPEFLECLADAEFIIGNSSAGIIEAPALGVPTINIGSRQAGREQAPSIIQANATITSVKAALDRLEEHRNLMYSNYSMPYAGINVAKRIARTLVGF